MTTQDYINAEIQRDRDARARAMRQSQQATATGNSLQQLVNETYGGTAPSEVILLRAKVRELTDKLAAETERCAKIAEDAAPLADAYLDNMALVGGVREGRRLSANDIAAKIRSGK